MKHDFRSTGTIIPDLCERCGVADDGNQPPVCTPTPVPAASERMTAERLADIRKHVAEFPNAPYRSVAADLLALVDKQAALMACADATLSIAATQFDYYAGNHDAKADQARQNNAPLAAQDAENKAEVNRKMAAMCRRGFVTAPDAEAAALSPQPDRAKADEDVESICVQLTGIEKGLFNPLQIDDILVRSKALIRTLSARAEAAEARAERARAEADARVKKFRVFWFGRGIGAAADWHDDRRKNTPDAFEMEFHEASAKAIRDLTAPPPTAKEG